MDLRESKISQGEGIGRHPWELARKEVVKSLINRFLPSFKNSERTILDIGCGDTWLIEQLSAAYSKAKFIAVDTAFDAQLLLEYKTRLAGKPFEVYDNLEVAMEGKEQKIDLVLLLDVIEHIADDIGFLKWVLTFSDQIDEKTHILITVPAFQSLFCEHDVFLGHYRRYTNKMLRKHIEEAGLESVRVGYFFTSLLPPRILQVIMEKLKPKKEDARGVGAWKKGAFDNVMKTILFIDYKITSLLQKIGIKLPGLSNYILCKRRV